MSFLTTVIPVFNGGRFLLPTLRAVARQTRKTNRLVVLDNCSTDNTPEIVAQFKECPCEWHKNETNVGLFGNLNRALGLAAETDCLHILTADDLITPEFYERLMSVLDQEKGRALAYAHYEIIDTEGRLLQERQVPARPAPRAVPLRRFLSAQSQLRTALVPAVILRTGRQLWPCRFRQDMAIVADSVFYAEAATCCDRLWEIPEVLSQYRRHPSSTTNHKLNELQSWCLDEWKAMNLILGWIKEPALNGWLRRQKLLCLFAARSRVKVKLVQSSSPEFAQSIAAATRQIVRPHHWWLGSLAVAARDGFYALRGDTPEIYKTTKI